MITSENIVPSNMDSSSDDSIQFDRNIFRNFEVYNYCINTYGCLFRYRGKKLFAYNFHNFLTYPKKWKKILTPIQFDICEGFVNFCVGSANMESTVFRIYNAHRIYIFNRFLCNKDRLITVPSTHIDSINQAIKDMDWHQKMGHITSLMFSEGGIMI